jgi:hypothetical protein
MPTITVINEDVRTVEATTAGERVLVDAAQLPDAIGWALKPEGLCRDDICVPVKDPGALHVGDALDLASVCRVLGRPVVVDAELGVVAVALPSEERRRAINGLVAAPFTLPDLDGVPHDLAEWKGRKKLLVAFSTW